MIAAIRNGAGDAIQTYAEAGVAIPSLNVSDRAPFLVDTGTTATVPHPADWKRLGITAAMMADAPQTGIRTR